MSMNLSTNYHKLALILALPFAGLLGAAVCVNAARLERDFESFQPVRSGVPEMKEVRGFADREDGPAPMGASRNLFTGPPLHVVKGTALPLDLSDPAAPPVHPPIPNRWWLLHGIDPGFADSPQRDADGDGFSNREEFDGQTDPSDFASHPPLIAKLRVANLEEDAFLLTYTAHTCNGAPAATDTYGFRYRDTAGRRNSQLAVPAGRGGASSFFAKAPSQLRLELRAVRFERVLDARLKVMRDVYTASLVDRRANKNGREYQVVKGAEGLKVRDFTAILFLDALGQAGKHFEVGENTSFSLPFDAEAAAKPFRFAGVRGAGAGQVIVIEFDEGGGKEELILKVPGP